MAERAVREMPAGLDEERAVVVADKDGRGVDGVHDELGWLGGGRG